MRGGLLIMGPVIDAAFGRQVRWFSWAALGISFAALARLASSRRSDHSLPLLAALNLGASISSATRCARRCMTKLAKVTDTRSHASLLRAGDPRHDRRCCPPIPARRWRSSAAARRRSRCAAASRRSGRCIRRRSCRSCSSASSTPCHNIFGTLDLPRLPGEHVLHSALLRRELPGRVLGRLPAVACSSPSRRRRCSQLVSSAMIISALAAPLAVPSPARGCLGIS